MKIGKTVPYRQYGMPEQVEWSTGRNEEYEAVLQSHGAYGERCLILTAAANRLGTSAQVF